MLAIGSLRFCSRASGRVQRPLHHHDTQTFVLLVKRVFQQQLLGHRALSIFGSPPSPSNLAGGKLIPDRRKNMVQQSSGCALRQTLSRVRIIAAACLTGSHTIYEAVAMFAGEDHFRGPLGLLSERLDDGTRGFMGRATFSRNRLICLWNWMA